MSTFSVIEGAVVILRERGVYRQTKVYQRGAVLTQAGDLGSSSCMPMLGERQNPTSRTKVWRWNSLAPPAAFKNWLFHPMCIVTPVRVSQTIIALPAQQGPCCKPVKP